MASNKLGNASMTSITRMMIVSVSPRKNPAARPRTMPKLSEMATEITPIKSDRRVPWISRESMSRPTGSVPSRNRVVPPASQAGGVNVNSRYCSFGGCGLTTSAKTASSTSNTTSARPITAPRLCVDDPQNSAKRPGGAPVATAGLASSAMTNARIDDAVERVDDQIDRDHDRCDQQNPTL